MWFYNNEFPSLLVEDGETVTITMDSPELRILALRPLNTAALLITCGIPSPSPARLSNTEAFERLESTEGHVDIGRPDTDGRIGGHTTTFLRQILMALDPERPVPSFIRWRSPVQITAAEEEEEATGHTIIREYVQNSSARPSRSDVKMPVPRFIKDLGVFTRVPFFSDIVVGRNSTLVIDPSINQLVANNFLCYRPSRIQDDSTFLALDVQGTLAGGLLDLVHRFDKDGLHIGEHVLQNMAFEKN